MYAIYISKESHRHEEVEQGTIHDWEEVRSEYSDPGPDPWRSLVAPVLRTIDRGELARISAVSERHIARLRNGNQRPSPEIRELLTRTAVRHARSHLGSDTPADDLASCAAFLWNLDSRKRSVSTHVEPRRQLDYSGEC